MTLLKDELINATRLTEGEMDALIRGVLQQN